MKEDAKFNRFVYGNAWWMLLLIIIIFCGFIYYGWKIISDTAEKFDIYRTDTKNMLLFSQGELINQYNTLGTILAEVAPSRSVRLERFTRLAKGHIKTNYESTCNMTDYELNLFVIEIFNKADEQMISPWLPIAFAQRESLFKKNAVSYAGAKGLFQFMPPTAKGFLGADYYPDCEFQPRLAVQLWFQYYRILNINYADVEEDSIRIQWMAAEYLSGLDAYRAYKYGQTISSYKKYLKDSGRYEDVDYITDVWTTYQKLLESYK